MTPVTTGAKRKTADGGRAVAGPLSAEELRKTDAYFRALNYLPVEAVIERLPQLGARAACFLQAIEEKLREHKHDIREHGYDIPEIAGWRWCSRDGAAAVSGASRTSTEGENV
jgi:phosphoketolase